MDRISKLPTGIIETILCLLPIQEAARTSILSREWRYHWTKIPKLAFVEDTFQVSIDGAELPVLEQTLDQLSERKETTKRCKLFYAIYQVLLMHQGPVHELTLSMVAYGCRVEIDLIILHLLKRNTVKILKLDFNGTYRLPLSFFSLHQLTDLYLNDCVLDHVPSSNVFGSLTTLNLQEILTSVKMLLHLSKRNTVKMLTLDLLYEGDEGYKLPISLFSLHQLTEMYLNDCSLFHECSFNEFGCLTTLYLENIWTDERTLIRLLSGCPLLKRLTLDCDGATISADGQSTVVDLFDCLPMIEYLSVSFFIISCFVPKRLPKELSTTLIHLKCLCMQHVCFSHKYGLPFLVLLIRSSPNLEKLKLEMFNAYLLEEDDIGSFTVEYYSDIMFEHLNELEMLNFSDSENELDFVKLILAKSPVLKKVRIALCPQFDEDEESQLSKILSCCAYASPAVKIIVRKFQFN